MKRLFSLAFLLAVALQVFCHPLHLSVTNINRDHSRLDISLTTFIKDWVTAYFHYHGKLPDPDAPADAQHQWNPWYDEYLAKHFRLTSEHHGEPLVLNVGSVRFDEEESMIVEMTAELPDNSDSLWIYNTLLTDIFGDQKNLVIFGSENNEIGIEFDARKKGHTVSLE